MEAPIFLLPQDGSHEIPLPGTLTTLEVPPDSIQVLETTSITTSLDDNPSHRVVIAFLLPGLEVEEAYDNPSLQHLIMPIGIVCEVVDQGPTPDGGFAAILHGIARTHISINEELGTRWCGSIFVSELLDPDERRLADEVRTVQKIITENPAPFSSKFVQDIQNEVSATAKMDLFAAEVLAPQSPDRISYITALDNLSRWDLITSGVHRLIRKGISQNATKKRKRANPKRRRAKQNKQNWRTDGLSHKERLKLLPVDESTRRKIQNVIQKVETLPSNSTEHGVLQDWLSWVFEMPWTQEPVQDFDLKKLRAQLDTTHYGLTEIKDILIEHMCIERLNGGSMGTVLCFVGPPGVGKSTIAQTMARASGRTLHSIALGGVSDESEIRGHRRAYVASGPGRFVSALRGTTTPPAFLLDEIDKLGRNGRGDPAAALLEILDPAQNHAFIDRYMGIPIDLSNALFLCTANYMNKIPGPLKDRMELIHFREYTLDERQHILREYLLPKCIKEFKLEEMPIEWPEETLDALAETTQIRKIEKDIKSLLRKYATRIHVYDEGPQIAKTTDLRKSKSSRRQLGFQLQ